MMIKKVYIKEGQKFLLEQEEKSEVNKSYIDLIEGRLDNDYSSHATHNDLGQLIEVESYTRDRNEKTLREFKYEK